MKAQAKSLNKLVEQLPPNDQREVLDFVAFLLEKNAKKTILNQNLLGLAH